MKTRDISQGGALVEFVSHTLLKNGTKLLVRLGIGVMGRAIVCRQQNCDNCALYSLRFDRFDAYSDLILISYLIKYERHQPVGSPGPHQTNADAIDR